MPTEIDYGPEPDDEEEVGRTDDDQYDEIRDNELHDELED